MPTVICFLVHSKNGDWVLYPVSYLKSKTMKYNFKHGLSEMKEYKSFRSIIARCYSRNNHAYKYYGARGIKVFAPWIKNQKLFINYIKSLPNYDVPNYSLDRINNNGNYEPGNLRWANKTTQVQNRTFVISEHNLIHWDKNKNKWRVAVVINKKKTHLGRFSTINEAIMVRNNFVSKYPERYIIAVNE